MSARRIAFLAFCQEQLGKPYRWNCDGPDAYDCNGIACGALKHVGGPDWRATHNAERLRTELPVVTREAAKPGDLVLYGPKDHANHVMIWFGDGRVIGASGGDRNVLTLEDAARRGACVKFKPTHLYRPDFLGFRSLAQHLDQE